MLLSDVFLRAVIDPCLEVDDGYSGVVASSLCCAKEPIVAFEEVAVPDFQCENLHNNVGIFYCTIYSGT